jgi:transcription antitermination factor NusG
VSIPNSHFDQWYALRVKSNCEKNVAAGIEGKGLEGFLPLYTRRHRWSDRIKSVESPLFPGYVFCRIDPARRLPVLTIPGALHFVSIGKEPVPVDESEISAILTAIRSGLPAEPWNYLEVGQRVRIEEGPLAGIEGILSENRKQLRVVVSVTLLQRSVAVEIDRTWLASAAAGTIGIPVTW